MSFANVPPPANGREPFLAFLNDEVALDVMRTVSIEKGWRIEACKGGGLRAAIQALSVAASPQVLVVDLPEGSDPLVDIDNLAEVCEPGTIVLAVGRKNDVALYRELVARGIHDYLLKPLAAGAMSEALARAVMASSAPSEKQAEAASEHTAIAVVGTRGGVGATMLATSIARLLSHEHKRSTALLDLDIHFGTGALALDLEPGRGLTDAIEDPLRIDGLFIERAMARVDERLAVLSAEAPLGTNFVSDGSAFMRLEQELSLSFEATVTDLPRQMMLNFPHLLSETGFVVIACELTLACARDAIRILAWLKTNAPAARTIVVANKVQAGEGEISRNDFAAAIEHGIDFAIPFDHKAAVNSARLGQSFAEANRGGKTTALLQAVARELVDARSPEAKEGARSGGARRLFERLDLKTRLSRKGSPASAAGA